VPPPAQTVFQPQYARRCQQGDDLDSVAPVYGMLLIVDAPLGPSKRHADCGCYNNWRRPIPGQIEFGAQKVRWNAARSDAEEPQPPSSVDRNCAPEIHDPNGNPRRLSWWRRGASRDIRERIRRECAIQWDSLTGIARFVALQNLDQDMQELSHKRALQPCREMPDSVW
jgi:hypothetical protein